jgi:hypothetical protein
MKKNEKTETVAGAIKKGHLGHWREVSINLNLFCIILGSTFDLGKKKITTKRPLVTKALGK